AVQFRGGGAGALRVHQASYRGQARATSHARPLHELVPKSVRVVLTGVPMIRKEFEYRRNAILSVGFARRTGDPAEKAHLLKLAETWLHLANLTHRQSGQRVRKIGEHPLIRAKLGARVHQVMT